MSTTLALALYVMLGCSGKTADSSNAQTANCPVGMPSDADIASTPRSDEDAELLAMYLDTGIVATSATYTRVSADLTKIRALSPELADMHVRKAQDDQTVALIVDDAGALSMKDASYHDWDCLNAHYGLLRVHVQDPLRDFGTPVEVKLKGRYAIDRMKCEYFVLPHVFVAGPSVFAGDGSSIYALYLRVGTTIHYVFDRASGDCPAGCTEHHATHFTSEADGSVARVDTYDVSDAQPAAEPAPEWFTQRRPYIDMRCVP